MSKDYIDKETRAALNPRLLEINKQIEELISQGPLLSLSRLNPNTITEFLVPLRKGIEVALKGLIQHSDGALGCGLRTLNLGEEIEKKLLIMAEGGKKLRPILYLLSELIISQDTLKVTHLILAALVELTHLLSLIVDDLVDREERRRKQATLHISIKASLREKGIQEVLATSLTGLVLGTFNPGVNFVMRKSLEIGQNLGLENKLYYLTYEAQNLLWLGFKNEILMNEFLISGNNPGTLEEYIDMINGKTATLFVYSVALALVDNRIDRQEKDSVILEDLIRRIGLAFQVADDVRDLWDAEYKERGVGGDIKERKPSVLTILASLYLPKEAKEKFFSLLGPQTNIDEVQRLFADPLIKTEIIDEDFYNKYGIRISKNNLSILELSAAMYYFNIQRAKEIISKKEIKDEKIQFCGNLIFSFFSNDIEKFANFLRSIGKFDAFENLML